MNPIGQTEFDKRREILKPYVGLRLNFEGVLVNINHANKRNGYHCGLVFASIYAKNEILELDHAVIKIHPKKLKCLNLRCYTRYTFTAEIGTYHKVEKVLSIPTEVKYYTINNINTNKIAIMQTSNLTQPTKYVKTRLGHIAKHDNQSNTNILALRNDGSIEKHVDQYLESFRKHKITKNDIITALYSKAN